MWTRRVLASAPAWALLVPLVWTQVGCGQQHDPFHAARQLIVDGKYVEGDAAMRKIVDEQPRGKFASRAGLFLFKCSVAQGNLDEAKKWCQWTIENHPQSLEAHKCRYKLAMVELMEGKRGAARERFEQLAKNPDGPLSAEAEGMVRFLKAYRIEPEEAAE